MKKTQAQINAEVDQMGKLITLGLTDLEVRTQLQIKHTQYYQYKRRLIKRSAQMFCKATEDDQKLWKMQLEERLSMLFRMGWIKLQRDDMKDPSGLISTLQNVAVNIFKLNNEGLAVLLRGKTGDLTNGHLRLIEGQLPTIDEAGNPIEQHRQPDDGSTASERVF